MRIKGDISSMDAAKEMRTELVEMDPVQHYSNL